MEKMITGFQFSPLDDRYMGEYEFPNNMDQEEIHLPPNTTLERPPAVGADKIVFRKEGKWVVEENPQPQSAHPEIADYAGLKPFFIDHLRALGQWSEEDQAKYDAAMAKLAEAAAAEKAARDAVVAGDANVN